MDEGGSHVLHVEIISYLQTIRCREWASLNETCDQAREHALRFLLGPVQTEQSGPHELHSGDLRGACRGNVKGKFRRSVQRVRAERCRLPLVTDASVVLCTGTDIHRAGAANGVEYVQKLQSFFNANDVNGRHEIAVRWQVPCTVHARLRGETAYIV